MAWRLSQPQDLCSKLGIYDGNVVSKTLSIIHYTYDVKVIFPSSLNCLGNPMHNNTT